MKSKHNFSFDQFRLFFLGIFIITQRIIIDDKRLIISDVEAFLIKKKKKIDMRPI